MKIEIKKFIYDCVKIIIKRMKVGESNLYYIYFLNPRQRNESYFNIVKFATILIEYNALSRILENTYSDYC